MSVVASKIELLHALTQRVCPQRESAAVHTGHPALDSIAPGGGFRCGAVHELLWPTARNKPGVMPLSVALLLAKSALTQADTMGVDDGSDSSGGGGGGVIAWSDPLRELYPPAVAAAGVDLRRLMLLRPGTPAEELTILAECLRCPGVLATVGVVSRLTQLQARRLQLAAEVGCRLGVLMRPAPASCTATATAATACDATADPSRAAGVKAPANSRAGPSDCYAAASRWLVRPEPGDDLVQRWRIQLVHGHGGRVGESVLWEVSRATGATTGMHPSETLANRPPAPQGAVASA